MIHNDTHNTLFIYQKTFECKIHILFNGIEKYNSMRIFKSFRIEEKYNENTKYLLRSLSLSRSLLRSRFESRSLLRLRFLFEDLEVLSLLLDGERRRFRSGVADRLRERLRSRSLSLSLLQPKNSFLFNNVTYTIIIEKRNIL